MKKLISALLLSATSLAFSQSESSLLSQAEDELAKYPERATEIFARLRAPGAVAENEQYRLNWLYQRYGFSLETVDIDRDQDKPAVCLVFNRAVRPQPLQDWAGKIRLSPAPEGGLRYLDDRLCFDGQWAATYQLRIDGTLESDNRVILGEPIERDIATGNRDPMLRFAAQGHVLALHGEQTLAFESTNIDSIRLQLWHFPREALANDTLHAALLDPQSYWADFKNNQWMRQRARNIFSGSFDVARVAQNSVEKSSVRFADMLGEHRADTGGFYLLNAWSDSGNQDEYGYDNDSQTLVFTLAQAGLSAYRTEEGLWVEARDLASAKTLAGLDIALYAKSGARIASVATDAKGMAHFGRAQITGQDGDAPSYLVAGNDDHGITWLDLESRGFDLADKGLNGAESFSTLNSWLWVDRGVYRPGETLHALWLIKNRDLTPFTAPLWLTISRPDGMMLENRALEPDASGAYRTDYAFASDAALGNWQIVLRLGRDGDIVSRDTVRIDSILPQTLEADLTRPVAPHAGENTTYRLSADWLYGAPAANIRVESSYRTGNAEGNAMPGWEGWQIGRHDDNTPPVFHNGSDTALATDAEGKADIPVFMPENHSTRPQSIRLTATLSPQGGRPLTVSTEDRIRRKLPYAAVKSEGQGAQIALVNDVGELQAGELAWTLYDLKYHYYWYRSGEQWHIRENVTRSLLESGKAQAHAQSAAEIPIPPGHEYESRLLEITGADPQTAASLLLGYQPDGNGTAPDRIRFADSEHKPYRNGDKVSLRLLAPFDGEGSVHLARDAIIDTLPVHFKDGIADVSFTWQSGWESGLWLLASGYNADQSGARNRRAVGLTWLAADTDAHRLPLQAEIPDSIEPGATLNLTFRGEGWINVAVIDDGLYQLSRATFSDPLRAFFGKKRLPLALFDVWGSVIRQLGGDVAKLRSGAGDGDEALSSALVDLPDIDMRNFIRFWSAPLQMTGGEASIAVPIPEGFNGRLRVMAANYHDKRFGHLEQTLTVRAPLVTELRTPAYLTVKDQGELLLRLHNTTDNPQTLSVNLQGQGLAIAPAPDSQNLTLTADESRLLRFPFTAEKAGESTLTAEVQSGDRRYALSRSLTVRSATLPRYLTRVETLQGGESREIRLAARSIIEPASRLPWSADHLAEALRRYPYWCSEQLTSRLTALREDARLFPNDADKQAAFRDPFNILLNRQSRDGGFSLWGGGEDELWLTAYVGETLLAEGKAPFADGTPQARLLRYLRSKVLLARDESEFQSALPGIAYAHLLLARHGMDLRGALINDSERLPARLALTPESLNLALAFAAYGDGERASALLARIDTTLESPALHDYRYSDAISRDGELLVRLHQWQEAMPDQAKAVSGWQESIVKRLALQNQGYLSTQAQSWLLRAAQTEAQHGGAATLDGEALTARQRILKPRSATLANPDNIVRYVTISELHYPSVEETESQGWQLNIRYEDFAGKALDPAALPLHENILVHVQLDRSYHGNSDVIFTCPLPAGVQAVSATADNDPLSAFGEQEWYAMRSYPEMEENRDDRHIAAFRLDGDNTAIRHTFVLKAVRSGQWHAPGCQVEDMYQPQHFARGKGQRITIKPQP